METHNHHHRSNGHAATRVLLVEDQSNIAQELNGALTALGYLVVATAKSGQEAIAASREVGPDLMIVDVAVPDTIDGMRAVDQIEHERAVATVFLCMGGDDHPRRQPPNSAPGDAGTKTATNAEASQSDDDLQGAIERALRASELQSLARDAWRWKAAALESQAAAFCAQLALQKQSSVAQLARVHEAIARAGASVARSAQAEADEPGGSEAERATDDELEPRPSSGDLQRMLSTAAHLERLSQMLNRFACIAGGAFTLETVDVSRLARSIIDGLRASNLGREVDVAIQDGVWLEGDCEQIQLLLAALLENAWKFTHKSRDARISFSAVGHAGTQICSVRDNGVGFDAKHAGDLFGLFERFHAISDFEGLGAGLAIAQRIVHRHGGQIWAESTAGRGAAFHFIL
jgi:signal transduction histidine kinase